MEILLRNFRNPSCVGTLIYLIYMCFFLGSRPLQSSIPNPSKRGVEPVTCDPLNLLPSRGSQAWVARVNLTSPKPTNRQGLFGWRVPQKSWLLALQKERGNPTYAMSVLDSLFAKTSGKAGFFWMCWKELPVFSNEVKDKYRVLRTEVTSELSCYYNGLNSFTKRGRERERERVRHWVISWF